MEDRIGAAIPTDLADLWSITFGGAIDYDLAVVVGEGELLNTSITELFYPGSSHYHDLFGWIDEEERLEDGRMVAVPFGGFEYLERVYAMLHGPRTGEVLLYSQGIPWSMRINEDTVTRIAPDVASLFDQLSLDDDPFTSEEEYARGLDMVQAVEDLRAAEPALAEQLADLIRSAVFDWRAVVSAPYRAGPEATRATRLALHHAMGEDHPELVRTLARHRFPLDLTVQASATALPMAMAAGAHAVAAELLSLGVGGADPIVFAPNAPLELVQRCMAARRGFAASAVVSLARSGQLDAAEAVATRGRRHGTWPPSLDTTLDKAITSDLESAERLRAGTLHSSTTAEDYEAQAARLRDLAARLKTRPWWKRLRG